MSYDAWVQEKQADEHGPSPSEASALSAILQGRSSPKEAATNMTKDSSVFDQGGLKTKLWRMWIVFIEAAQDFPEKHSILVKLLQAIQRLPGPLHHGKPILVHDMRVWADLPRFGWEMREFWNYLDPPWDRADQSETRRRWKNLNAFAARLTTAKCQDFLNFGLWSLRDALEQKQTDILSLDGHAPAAAQWMLHAGQAIFECEEEIKPSATGGDPYRPGELWSGKHGFCRKRWEFWKQRFAWVAEVGRLDNETRACAREAFMAMGRIDGSGSP